MDFGKLKSELEQVKLDIARVQLLKEQAQQKCSEIEKEFGVSSLEELEEKYNVVKQQLDEKMVVAKQHLEKVKVELNGFQRA